MIKEAKHLYYRGVIKSCNYTCSYCPFAKHKPSVKEVGKDQLALNRFYEKVKNTFFKQSVSIMLTPYGEALIYPHVQRIMGKLSNLDHVAHIGIQTNLSCDVHQLIMKWQQEEAQLDKIKLWCSFHPEMTSVDDFVQKVLVINEFIEVSIGVVGNPNNIHLIKELREKLPSSIYLWINKMDGLRRRYTNEEIDYFQEIDPFFEMELKEPRAAASCMGGKESFFIEATGKVFACNRNKECMGNLYEGLLTEVPCARKNCDCYLAYSNLKDLLAMKAFGEKRSCRVLEKNEFKAIFLDIDGTLTDKKGIITSETKIAIEYLAKKSRLYVVTALPYKIAMNKCAVIKAYLSGGIFDNGMDIREFESNYKEKYSFTPEMIEQLKKIEYLKGKLPSQPTTKILLRILKRDMESLMEQLKKLPEDKSFEIGREQYLVYITPRGCNKLEQTNQFCKRHNWDKQQILVVGNSENDRAWLEAFSYSVAVPCSDRKVKEVATYCMKVSQIPMIVK